MPGATDFVGLTGIEREGLDRDIERLVSSHHDPAPYRRTRLRLEVDAVGYVPGKATPLAVLREEITGEAQEVLLVAAIDAKGEVADVAEVARGGYHSVSIQMPALLAVPLLAGCEHLVMAHNHPSGRLYPSEQDYQLTREVAVALNHCGIVLDDHLLFGPDGQHLSMREAHVLEVPEPKTQTLEVQT